MLTGRAYDPQSSYRPPLQCDALLATLISQTSAAIQLEASRKNKSTPEDLNGYTNSFIRGVTDFLPYEVVHPFRRLIVAVFRRQAWNYQRHVCWFRMDPKERLGIED